MVVYEENAFWACRWDKLKPYIKYIHSYIIAKASVSLLRNASSEEARHWKNVGVGESSFLQTVCLLSAVWTQFIVFICQFLWGVDFTTGSSLRLLLLWVKLFRRGYLFIEMLHLLAAVGTKVPSSLTNKTICCSIRFKTNNKDFLQIRFWPSLESDSKSTDGIV